MKGILNPTFFPPVKASDFDGQERESSECSVLLSGLSTVLDYKCCCRLARVTCSFGPEARPITCNVFIALRNTSNIMWFNTVRYSALLYCTTLLPFTINYTLYAENIIVYMIYYDKFRQGRGLSARGVTWRFRDPPSPQSFRSQRDIHGLGLRA